MKKIVALVLSLVMALSLCTVAFAAKDDGKFEDGEMYVFFDKDGNYKADAEFVAANDPNPSKGEEGNVAYFYDADQDTYYVTCKSTDKGALHANSDSAGAAEDFVGWVKLVDDAVEADFYYVAKAVDTATRTTTVDCTHDRHCAGYTVKASDLISYLNEDEQGKLIYVVDEDKLHASADTFNILVGNDVKTVGIDEDAVYASHVLYLNSTTAVSRDVYSYTCAVCKNVYYGTSDIHAAKANSEWYFGDDAAEVKDALKVKLPDNAPMVTDDLYIWRADGKTADTNNGINSPKTFDAGIAMYVGMSLLSVAGGAVVIGKKKEF